MRFRRFAGESDYAALSRVGNASRLADGNEWVQTAEDVEREFKHLVNSDPTMDMVIAEVDGELAGFARGEWWHEPQAEAYRYWFNMQLAPEQRGRGIRRAMLRWMEDRLRVVAAAHPNTVEKTYLTYANERSPDMRALLDSEGYRITRYYNRMVRSLDKPITDYPLPAGLEMRPVLPDHFRLLFDAHDEAFQDHYGFSPTPEEYFSEWQADPVIFQPDLWQVAWDVERNEVAGQVRTFIDALENETYGRLRGYTEYISVRRPYRKRGLARALISESLRLQKARGMTESALMVDSENITGATRLYEDSGFQQVFWSASYQKPLQTTARAAGNHIRRGSATP